MDLQTKLMAQIAVALDNMQAQLDYNRDLLIDSIGGEPVLYNNNNVLIGTTTDDGQKLQVYTTGTDVVRLLSTATVASANLLVLERTTNVASTEVGVEFRDYTAVASGNVSGRIYTKREGSTAKWGLHLQPDGVDGVGINIDSYGNTGINKASPLSKLAVVGLPTSATGLTAGDIWVDTSNNNVLKIVT